MATNFTVYVGLWRDYSESGLNQVILTLPIRWGNVLVSFLALIVSFAGTATWKVVAYILHQARVRHATRSDPLQQQVQALLRNRTTPVSALSDAFWIILAWAQSPHPALRTVLPTALLAGLITAAFAVFSIFVSAVATSGESNVSVLARPGQNCGGWDFNWTVTNVLDNSIPNKIEFLRARVDDTVAARSYATWFYSRDKQQPLAATSSVFPISQLPYEISMAPCPFLGQGRCLSNDTTTPNPTLVLDTGLLDSHVHLGINAPFKDRSSLRLRMECSPIDIRDAYRPVGEQDGYSSFDFSGFMNMSRSTVVLPSKRDLLNVGYSTGCQWWVGAMSHLQWPVKLSDSRDRDISVCVVSQNSIRYEAPVYDPLFLATGKNTTAPFVYGDNPFNAIACTQQVQFCNPTTGTCTKLTHAAQAFNESVSNLGFNAFQATAIKRSALLLGLTDISTLGPSTLGASGLLAREAVFGETLSFHLPPDHWQREVRLWYETKLALLQAHVVRFLDRIDLSSPLYANTLIYRPYDSMPKGAERDAVYAGCQNQRIATTGQYQNFKFWAVALIVIVCLVILALSVALDPAMRFIRRKWWHTEDGDAKQRARDHDGLYWLLRMALEAQGVGPWRRGGRKADSEIPVVDGFYSSGFGFSGYGSGYGSGSGSGSGSREKGEEMLSTPTKE